VSALPESLTPLSAADPRLTLARGDLAEQALEGIVCAAAYRPTRAMQCAVPAAPLRKAPDPAAEQQDQLVFGEIFEVLEVEGGFAFGRARRDGYVGWVPTEALTAEVLAPTHRVSAIRTYAFAEPDMKAASPVALTLNSLVTVEARNRRFVRVARTGWIPEAHLAALDEFDREPVAVAERFVGAPYQWGGRESVGLDCSGLVQQALYACGRGCARDADQQEAELGEPIAPETLRRGDLVFWNGHVGLMTDGERLIHATGWHMAVVVEPLADVVARMHEAGAGAPTAYRRL